MANKLKEIFSNEPKPFLWSMKFNSKEARDNFIKALTNVCKDGSGQEVKGGISISTECKNGNSKYPIRFFDNIKSVRVSPHEEQISLKIDVDGVAKDFLLFRIQITDGVILHTRDDAIIYLEMKFTTKEDKLQFTYKTNLSKAETISSIIEAYQDINAFIKTFFIENEEIASMMEFFTKSILYFKRLSELQNTLDIEIKPSNLADERDEDFLVEKLYVLLVQKKALKTNKRLDCFIEANTDADDSKIESIEGKPISVNFIESHKCKIYKAEFDIYTVNFINNAVVTKIEKQYGGSIRIYLENIDSKPIYISCKAFKTKNEADIEMNSIMQCKDSYIHAKSLEEHMEEIA